jgi:DNA-binding NtrC family response regulator
MSRPRVARLKIEAVLKRAAEPVFLLDAERRIVFFNPACEELTGRSADGVLGLQCSYGATCGADESGDVAASLAAPPEVFQGAATTVRTLLARPGAEPLWRQIHFFPCHDPSGKLLAVVGMLSELPPVAPADHRPHATLHENLLRLRSRLFKRYGFQRIVAASPPMRRVLDQVKVASQMEMHVLVWGEPGTGKEFVARTIHRESARRHGPFVPIDCALLVPEVLEDVLFGARPDDGPGGGGRGLVRSAEGGTLFLNNLTQLPRDAQSRLGDMLRRARPGELVDEAGAPIDLRLIAADRSDPAAALERGELRADLYFALSTMVIHLPPLRERTEDIPLLAQAMLEAANGLGDKQISGISPEAIGTLCAYDWPDNLRELDEVVRLAHARAASTEINNDALVMRIRAASRTPAGITPATHEPVELDAVLLKAERKLIELALRKARGNKSKAAELLSISRPRLYRRMAMLGMEPPESAADELEMAEETELA